MSRKELEAVLDYILNKADEGEFEVIAKACQRRARDKTAFASLGGEGPGAMARRMAGELEKGVGATMESVRATVRGYVADIIRKNAPEVSEEQLAALLDEYAPEPGKARPPARAPTALPPQAILGMARSFVEYSEGRMAPSRQQELWEEDPRWQNRYWEALPAEVKALVKAYLEGRIDGDTFGTGLLSVLGL
ncbi:MAG TPA: hypothetical protein PLB91_02665 [Spirochaetales bacterium]|nr:hypothetical protein [Spirochaetales bacterium]HRY54518.1 hypothetical protein [Spirochaetia bacterium]HRZ65882.1 hypothetical protein [Spirochaetia bacterium]